MDGEREWGSMASRSLESEGMYSDDNIDEEDGGDEESGDESDVGAEPTLEDIAGKAE